jgi:hypothetical protein
MIKLKANSSYLVNLGVSHKFLDWILGVEAVSAKDLHGIGSTFVGYITSKSLGNRGQVCVAFASVDLPSGFLVAKTSTLNANGHLGQHESNSLMLQV